MNSDLKKKYRIETFYRYKEIKRDNVIDFGWSPADATDVDIPFVLTKGSKSKNLNSSEKLSASEPPAAINLEDFEKYFTALLQSYFDGEIQDCHDFWDKFKDDKKAWMKFAKEKTPGKEQAESIYNSVGLICEERKFTFLGRIYKIIK